MLEREFGIYKSHRDEFLRDHAGEYVVIKGDLILGFFKTELEAFLSMKDYQLGTFLVKKCESVDEETAHYASRVVIFT
jgi:hypothetical protein